MHHTGGDFFFGHKVILTIPRHPRHPSGQGPDAGLAAGHRRQRRAVPGAAGSGAGEARPADRQPAVLLEGTKIGRGRTEKQLQARIEELTRSKAEAVRDSFEKSIADLGQRQKELEEKLLFADHAVRELESGANCEPAVDEWLSQGYSANNCLADYCSSS